MMRWITVAELGYSSLQQVVNYIVVKQDHLITITLVSCSEAKLKLDRSGNIHAKPIASTSIRDS
jgi:hypothetical protein